jgi:SAM-dependent methyltransferase
MSETENPGQIDFWEERYRSNKTGWDIGQAAPPFVSYLEEASAPSAGKIIVLGCGRGHDALFFAQKGFQVTGVDFAPSAINVCRERAAKLGLQQRTHFEARNIFELLPQYQNTFDYVLEHTCFCAIPPERRPNYVELVAGLLKPGGKIIALFFTHGQEGGPPYDTNPAELHALFDKYFEFERLEKATNSTPQRRNEETFGVLVRR